MKKAYTLIELVVVITIIGIMSAVAIPKLMGYSDDAKILRFKEEYIKAQSKISFVQDAMMRLKPALRASINIKVPGKIDYLCADRESSGSKRIEKFRHCTKGESLSALDTKKMKFITYDSAEDNDRFYYPINGKKIFLYYDNNIGAFMCATNLNNGLSEALNNAEQICKSVACDKTINSQLASNKLWQDKCK